MAMARHIFQACPVWILRVTSQASYSPDYITPTQKKNTNIPFAENNISPLGCILFVDGNYRVKIYIHLLDLTRKQL
jgi:hypothetical protein